MGKISEAGLRSKKLKTPGTYGDGAGLYLQVRGPTNRSWIFRYKLHGRSRLMGLGPYGDVGLADARGLAAAARRLVRQGIDPIEERRAKRAAEAATIGPSTFAEVAAAYIAAHEAAWRNAKHRQQWVNTLNQYAGPILGRLSVSEIDGDAVVRVLQPIWLSKPETASRVRGRIEAVLDYAKSRGLRSGENPARWRGHLNHQLPRRSKVSRVRHHAALPWRTIGLFMEELRGQPGVATLALQFTILTAARTGEVTGAVWREIDSEQGVWTIPAERMKAGVEHRVPLSSAALAVIDEVAKRGTKPATFVFSGPRAGRPLSNAAMSALLVRMGWPDITVHGFRSCFRDWCAEATNHPREVAEAALAHTLRDKVEAAYQRGDLLEKRRRLMEEWGAFCRPPSPEEKLPLRRSG